MRAYAHGVKRRRPSIASAQAGVVAAVLAWREGGGGLRAPHCSIRGAAAHRRAVGGYWLVAGARGLQAARAEGIERVPAVVRDPSDRQSVAVAIVEHLRREDLNAIDDARSLVCLMEEFDLGHEDVTDTLGRSRAVMSSALRLLNLDSTVQRLVVGRRPEKGRARAPLALKPAEQGRAARRIVEDNRAIGQAGRLVRAMTEPRPAWLSSPVSSDSRVPERWRNRVVVEQTPKGANVRFIRVRADELDALVARLRLRDTVAASGDP